MIGRGWGTGKWGLFTVSRVSVLQNESAQALMHSNVNILINTSEMYT